jgi:hypothetical protein
VKAATHHRLQISIREWRVNVGGELLLRRRDFTIFACTRTEIVRNHCLCCKTLFTTSASESSWFESVRERTDSDLLWAYLVRTQQAGWPRLTYPSRLTLRNVQSARPFSCCFKSHFQSRGQGRFPFIASVSYAKYCPPCPLHRGS